MICGDEIEVYYTDTLYDKIDHILVEEADVVAVTNSIVPGSNTMDIYVPDSDSIVINHINVWYVIHEDGSFEEKQKIQIDQTLYAVYQKSEIKQTT